MRNLAPLLGKYAQTYHVGVRATESPDNSTPDSLVDEQLGPMFARTMASASPVWSSVSNTLMAALSLGTSIRHLGISVMAMGTKCDSGASSSRATAGGIKTSSKNSSSRGS